LGPSIVRVTEFIEPERFPLQLTNTYPGFALAVTVISPASCQVSDAGVIVPVPEGLTVVVNLYCVFQFQVIVESSVIVKVVVVPVPEAGTEPVPVQPVHRY